MAAYLRLILWAGLFTISLVQCFMTKSWEYTIEKVETSSTDPSIIDLNLGRKRVSRGVYGLHGNITIGEGIDNDFVLGVTAWRSADGSSAYYLTPFRVPPTHLYDFVAFYYKRFCMPSVKNCSDWIQFETERYDRPIPAKVYTMNKCLVFDAITFPDYFRAGYYMIVVAATRSTDVNFKAFLNITLQLEEKWT